MKVLQVPSFCLDEVEVVSTMADMAAASTMVDMAAASTMVDMAGSTMVDIAAGSTMVDMAAVSNMVDRVAGSTNLVVNEILPPGLDYVIYEQPMIGFISHTYF